MIVSLDQDFIEKKLICPPGKARVEFVDQGGLGMYVEARASSPGVGTFYLRFRDPSTNKTTHAKLGSTAVISLADARREAKRLKAEITLGKDPRKEKAKHEVPTLTEFWDDMYFPYIQPRKRSWKRDLGLFRPRIEDTFGSKRLDQITRQDLQKFHTELLATLAPATANHHIRLLKTMYFRAQEWDVPLARNPAARLPLAFENNKIERYMDDEQLARLLNVLRTDPNRNLCRVALFLLATGARLGEALTLKWVDVDLRRRLFVVQATHSKSKKLRSVPINDAALDVLKEIAAGGTGEYVFANPETGLPFHRFGHTWLRLRRKAGLPSLRIHDLRHQFASMLVSNGQNLATIQRLLGHSSPVVTQRYAHLSTEALFDAANAASEKLQRCEPAAGG